MSQPARTPVLIESSKGVAERAPAGRIAASARHSTTFDRFRLRRRAFRRRSCDSRLLRGLARRRRRVTSHLLLHGLARNCVPARYF